MRIRRDRGNYGEEETARRKRRREGREGERD